MAVVIPIVAGVAIGAGVTALVGTAATGGVIIYFKSKEFKEKCREIACALLDFLKAKSSEIKEIATAIEVCIVNINGPSTDYPFRPLKILVSTVQQLLGKFVARGVGFVKFLVDKVENVFQSLNSSQILKKLKNINLKALLPDGEESKKVCEYCENEKPLQGGSNERLYCSVQKCGNWRHLGCWAKNSGVEEDHLRQLPFKCAGCAKK